MTRPRCTPSRAARFDPALGPSGINAKRWAQRADQLPFTQLADVRLTAQNWRTGLAALTSLLSVTSVVVAPTLSDKLVGCWRIGAGALLLAGLLTLLYGTWQTMVAAFGVPEGQRLVTGATLWAWESEQTYRGSAALRRARWATLFGLLLIIATSAVVVIGTTRPQQQGPLVRVDTGHGSFCGHLTDGTTSARLGIVGNDGTVHLIAGGDLREAKIVPSC